MKTPRKFCGAFFVLIYLIFGLLIRLDYFNHNISQRIIFAGIFF